MVTVGMDVHKSFSFVTATDTQGQILDQRRLPNTRRQLSSYFTHFEDPPQVAIEACWNWQWIADLLAKKGCQVHLSHPLKTKAIAAAKIKTDKVDSEVLAHLLRADLLPTSYIPSRKERYMRDLVRHRIELVQSRSKLANRIWALFAKEGIDFPYRCLFTQRGRLHLEKVKLPSIPRKKLDQILEQEKLITRQVEELDVEIESHAARNPQALALMTIPGIGPLSAMVLLSEIGNIDRFPSAKHLCSYFGLVPSVHQSGPKRQTGHITKQGSRHARWVLVQAARHAARGTYKNIFRKIQSKRGSNIAYVAIARKLVIAVYQVLKNKEVFDR